MYSNIVYVLHRVLGESLTRHVIWMLPLLAFISLLLLCLPAWRRRERDAAAGRVRLRLLTLALGAVFRVTVTVAVVGGLAAALLAQKGLFSERHGRVTERNLSAVQTKWGVAHEQRDLRVKQSAMHKVVEEELADGSSRERTLPGTQTLPDSPDRVVLDEETITTTDEQERKNPRRVVRRTTALVRRNVDQDAIESVEAQVRLRSNPRRLGGAVYAGYDDAWALRYRVRNRADHATEAFFRFPLPSSGHGLFDRLVVRMDGQDWLPRVRCCDAVLQWHTVMAAGETHSVEVGYVSRGLEYFRYKPGNMRERCVVAVEVEGIDAQHLNFPIGSMPPRDDLKKLAGSRYTLNWDLSRAVTNLDIGVIVPTQQQPGYYVVQLLGAAPLGLVLLGASLLLTRWLLAGSFDLFPVALVLVVYYLAFALLAHLNDVLPSFAGAFVLGVAPLVLAVGEFWRRLDGPGRLAGQSWLLTGALAIVYPLMALAGDYSGTLLHVLYVALAVYILGLVAWRVQRERAAAA